VTKQEIQALIGELKAEAETSMKNSHMHRRNNNISQAEMWRNHAAYCDMEMRRLQALLDSKS
jgi:hypothetical protein